jgi:hypothetical protein
MKYREATAQDIHTENGIFISQNKGFGCASISLYPEQFKCDSCKEIFHRSVGYGYQSKDDLLFPVCYACCGKEDEKQMRETGKAVLYLSHEVKGESKIHYAGNWPGTLKIRIGGAIKYSWHNFAGKDGRRDVWFKFDGSWWHGVNIGDNDLLRCKRLKGN